MSPLTSLTPQGWGGDTTAEEGDLALGGEQGRPPPPLTAGLPCVPSVPIPFRGDYIGLQGNPKLQRLKSKEDGPVLVADTVRKVNRGNGKVKSHCAPPHGGKWPGAGCACSSVQGRAWVTMPVLAVPCVLSRHLPGFSSSPRPV